MSLKATLYTEPETIEPGDYTITIVNVSRGTRKNLGGEGTSPCFEFSLTASNKKQTSTIAYRTGIEYGHPNATLTKFINAIVTPPEIDTVLDDMHSTIGRTANAFIDLLQSKTGLPYNKIIAVNGVSMLNSETTE